MAKPMTYTVQHKTIKLFIPYSDVDNIEWDNEGITVQSSVHELLSMLLPMGCLNEEDCCAVKFVREEDRIAERKPVAVRQPSIAELFPNEADLDAGPRSIVGAV